jgi:translation initiation factor IF-2
VIRSARRLSARPAAGPSRAAAPGYTRPPPPPRPAPGPSRPRRASERGGSRHALAGPASATVPGPPPLRMAARNRMRGASDPRETRGRAREDDAAREPVPGKNGLPLRFPSQIAAAQTGGPAPRGGGVGGGGGGRGGGGCGATASQAEIADAQPGWAGSPPEVPWPPPMPCS